MDKEELEIRKALYKAEENRMKELEKIYNELHKEYEKQKLVEKIETFIKNSEDKK